MKKIKKIITIAMACMTITGCISQSNAKEGNMEMQTESSKAQYTQISQDEAMKLMETEKDYIIVDARTEGEYADGHIPNAINIPNESIGEEEIPALPNKDQLILVYCRSGNRSRQASEKLAQKGYTRVMEFGGINTWKGEVVK